MIRIKVKGIVQGVGFRPFIFRLARDLNLNGYVLNSSSGVTIEIEGKNGSLERFIKRLKTELPPIARIDELMTENLPDQGYRSFTIRESREEKGSTLISPDLATCSDCLREMRDHSDHRHQYPFINCTNCGPRYSIIYKTPYDRPNTTMKIFKMCPNCAAEYHDPLNRRFHAQPNACPTCGPGLTLLGPHLRKVKGDPITRTKELLINGKIIGIKGIGGFHIGVDPRIDNAILRLRQKKNRPHKPFAVMVRLEDLGAIVRDSHPDLLRSPQAPILLLPKKSPNPLSEFVAPDNPYLGVFLPYAPIHHLLLGDDLPYLIMTSGNLADEPIARDESELVGLCDYFLTNDRPIENRVDDSIIFPTTSGPTILRRSRGYIPDPIDLIIKTVPTLACGGELKGTFGLARDHLLYLSPHLGDLESKETMDFFKETLDKYKRWFKIEPEIVACDLHPDYLTTRFAESLNLPLFRIQHHHAHIASVLIDNYQDTDVIGVAYDGTGYGTDGKIWGCEIMVANLKDFQRRFHLSYLPLPGGDKAVKRPVRIAISYLITSNVDYQFLNCDPDEARVVRRQLDSGFNLPLTSSLGRLFDCISAILGLFDEITFEAQAAMGLEFLATPAITEKSYPYNIDGSEIDPRPLIRAIAHDVQDRVNPGIIARAFHNTVIAFTVEAIRILSDEAGIKTVALSGGVFQNRIILEGLINRLKEDSFDVLIHHKLPPNDGCVSAGQVAISNVSCYSG
ncbi:MAG TPA: carbamoyltransferase HypF [bacterium (Candidatus Stahlbacteria)]|nr:carbamoyltransferase HypF [Candidatus Stahlbacteria bacterium]